MSRAEDLLNPEYSWGAYIKELDSLTTQLSERKSTLEDTDRSQLTPEMIRQTQADINAIRQQIHDMKVQEAAEDLKHVNTQFTRLLKDFNLEQEMTPADEKKLSQRLDLLFAEDAKRNARLRAQQNPNTPLSVICCCSIL